jgi:hypothetical protein
MNPRVVLLAAALAPSVVLGQTPVRGRVLAAENGQPLAGVSVYAVLSRRGADTDRHGRFVLWLRVVPDTLVARFIGRAPEKVVVLDTVSGAIVLRLAPAAVPLTGVVVEEEAGRRADEAAQAATWELPREAVAAVPGAVENDVFRGLVLAPAVAYSTPLSSQPFVRGTDPGAVSYRLDGFTVINPFHLGRIFSALMPQAVQGAKLAAAPFDVEYGDATSGVIDAQLREGGDEIRGGGQASFVSTAAWAGGPAGPHRWFTAWRHGFLEHIRVAGDDIPYRFNDLYGRFAIAAPWGPVNITAFWSGDHVFEPSGESGVEWSNGLLGVRAPLALSRSGRMELWGEHSRFHEDVVQLPIRGENTDVRNRFSTTALGTRVQWTWASTAASISGEFRRRHMINQIEGGIHSAPSVDAAGTFGAATATLERRTGRLTIRAGLRLDADRHIRAWQPRLHIGTDLGDGWSLGVATGRTARLYHIINEVLPGVEDILSIYDLWRPAGQHGIPLSVADHGVLELKRNTPGLSLRASAFASRLRGVGEVRGSILQPSDSAFFRFGRGRVAGLDAQLALAGPRRNLALSYVLSWSRRAWDRPDAAEIPWRYDRRHQGRAFASLMAGRGWRLHLLGELTSSDPITPAIGTAGRARLLPDGSLDRGSFGFEALVFGPENSTRGGWMGHLDVGFQKEIGGPGRSVGRLGISVLNLGFTPIAPGLPEIKYDENAGFSRVLYTPKVFLPPIPTLTFMLEF